MARRPLMNRLRSEFRQKGGGSRHTTMRTLGGKLGRHGTPFHKNTFQFEDEREGARIVDVVEVGTCAFGHTIDEKVRVAGICEIGGEVLCSTEGCMRTCTHCGAAVCRNHSRSFGDRTYCTRHSWIHYWRIFWRLD